MNNAIINAAQQFTAAKGGVFAAVAVRPDASHMVPAATPRVWRYREQLRSVDREPLTRPVCLSSRG